MAFGTDLIGETQTWQNREFAIRAEVLSAKEILERLRSSVVLPMHVRAYDALPRFLTYLGEDFAVQRLKENKIRLSLRNLPKQPTVMILPGVGTYYPPEE